MKRFATVIAAVVGVLFASLVWADPLPLAKPEQVGLSSERLERLGQVVKAEIAKGHYPGAVALVARKGRIAYFESFGQRDAAAGAAMPKDAIFRIASMTKPFTSVGAMILMEEGRLVLSDPVSKYLPSLAKLEVAVQKTDGDGKPAWTMVPAAREMTIHDLLRHTSGLAYAVFTRNAKVKELYEKVGVDWRNVTAAEQVERLAKVPLAHQPGTAFEYSLSTDVLGRVIETITGVSLARFLEERVFTPLKMTNTGFLVPKDKADRLARPFPTDRATGKPIVLLDVTAQQKNDAGGAGAVSTAADYARFLQMLVSGGRLDGVRLLSRSTVSHMTADHLGDIKISAPWLAGHTFGLGFAVRKDSGLNGVPGTAGEYTWFGAFGTYFWVDPKEEMITILMTQVPFGPSVIHRRQLLRQLVQQAIVD